MSILTQGVGYGYSNTEFYSWPFKYEARIHGPSNMGLVHGNVFMNSHSFKMSKEN